MDTIFKNYDCRQKKAYSEALLACSLRQHKWPAYPLDFGASCDGLERNDPL